MNKIIPTNGRILLGRQGENFATQVIIPLTVKQGEGYPVFIHQRSRDLAPYPIAVEELENSVVWPVSSLDTYYPGEGRAELRWIGENGEIVKSQIFATYTIPSMAEPSEVPPEWQGYSIADVAVNASLAASSAQEAKASEEAATAAAEVATKAAEEAELTPEEALEMLIESGVIIPVGVDGAILTDDNGKIVVV